VVDLRATVEGLSKPGAARLNRATMTNNGIYTHALAWRREV